MREKIAAERGQNGTPPAPHQAKRAGRNRVFWKEGEVKAEAGDTPDLPKK